MKRLIVASILMLLPGCALIQGQIADRGAEVSDNARATAEFTLCKGITVGSWVRRFGDSAELANAWRTLCSEQIKQVPK